MFNELFPCPNCFKLQASSPDEMQLYYWLCYGLWQAKAFRPYLVGSVIPFLRIDDLHQVLNHAGIKAETDPAAPVILLDHQPYDLSQLAGTPVDLQMSGHTHNGQMWPLSLITRSMFELSHGYKMFGKTHVIVSSGFGVWGPRMRIGTRPEILSVTLSRKSE